MTRNGQIDHEDLLPTPVWCDFTIPSTKHNNQHFACAGIIFSSLIKVIIWGINENKKRKCFKWRTIAVGFKVYGWKNTVSKYWCINPFERILENSSKYFLQNLIFLATQTNFSNIRPFFRNLHLLVMNKTDFLKTHPYLVGAWMSFPELSLAHCRKIEILKKSGWVFQK